MGNSIDFKEDIKLREKLCYTSGNVAAVLVNTTLSSYLMYFYTDILGIAASAAAAIFLFSRIWDAFNDPLMGMVPGIKAFVAAVVGGIGSVPGAAVGGFLIGLLETGVQAVSLSAYKDAAVYLVLIIMLVVLPAGLFGKRQREKV